MVRLVRIATVTLLLAALPTLAWAECAWVLWGYHETAKAQEGSPRAFYSPIDGYETRAACIAEQQGQIAFVQGRSGGQKRGITPTARGAIVDLGKDGSVVNEFVCLPNGTDPRPR